MKKTTANICFISQTKKNFDAVDKSDQKMNYIWWFWLQENSVDHDLLN